MQLQNRSSTDAGKMCMRFHSWVHKNTKLVLAVWSKKLELMKRFKKKKKITSPCYSAPWSVFNPQLSKHLLLSQLEDTKQQRVQEELSSAPRREASIFFKTMARFIKKKLVLLVIPMFRLFQVCSKGYEIQWGAKGNFLTMFEPEKMFHSWWRFRLETLPPSSSSNCSAV